MATLGIYKHKDSMTPELLADMKRQRSFAWHKRFLEEVLGSSPRPEIAYNIEHVRHSIDAPGGRGRTTPLVRRGQFFSFETLKDFDPTPD